MSLTLLVLTACQTEQPSSPTDAPTDTGVEDSAGFDTGCDEASGEGTVYFPDLDGDGYGADAGAALHCVMPPGMIAVGGDCDDTDPEIHPETVWYEDSDEDGFGVDESAVTQCAAPGEAWVRDGSDCDDLEPTTHPGASEVCDGADNDCNGQYDDDAVDAPIYYDDLDGDGWGDPDSEGMSDSCWTAEAGTTSEEFAYDCDDSDPLVNPTGTEICDDGLDQDCTGRADNGCLVVSLEGVEHFAVHGQIELGLQLLQVGDVTGDGRHDLLVSDPEVDDRGAVYLLSGGIVEGEYDIEADAFRVVEGTASLDQVGKRIAWGDANGDATPDLVVGVDGEDDDYTYVFYGPFTGRLDLGDADVVVENLLETASALGITGGIYGSAPELVIGSKKAKDMSGSEAGVVGVLPATALDGTVGAAAASAVTFWGDPDDWAGTQALANADLDGDGVVDLVVGAPSEGTEVGSVYVLAGPLSGTYDAASADLTLVGEAAGDLFGEHVSAGGDVDDDGTADLLVGSQGYDGTGTNVGALFVVPGPIESGHVHADELDGRIVSDTDFMGFGAATDVGDVDGDGSDDVYVGASGTMATGGITTGSGITPGAQMVPHERSYLFYGPLPFMRLASSADVIVDAGIDIGSRQVACRTDLDGDGSVDLLATSTDDATSGIYGIGADLF